jgi:muramoyltetrapeptide carboxypeptidase
VSARTRLGLRKFRSVEPRATIAVVAPASYFVREEFDAGVAELRRLGFQVVFDESVFDREPITAGSAATRAKALRDAWMRDDVDAIVAVRGGYGSAELLPLLDAAEFRARPKALIGYSDLTSLHAWVNGQVGATSVHGAMLDGRLSKGESAYDAASFLRSLSTEPMGELAIDGVDVLRSGEAIGPLVGGTIMQLAASLGTPYTFTPPDGAVLFLEDVAERPYRLRRLLVQLQHAGRFDRASAIVVGQMPRCDEADGRVTARSVIDGFFKDFRGPVLYGFPSGHTTTPMVSLPFGVQARVVTDGRPRLIIEESAAE